MKCPDCEMDLVMAERQGIEIDYCAKCRGVWLDRGELDKIIERSNKELQTAAAVQQNDLPQEHGSRGKHGHGKHGYGRSGRKSTFHNLFNIFD